MWLLLGWKQAMMVARSWNVKGYNCVCLGVRPCVCVILRGVILFLGAGGEGAAVCPQLWLCVTWDHVLKQDLGDRLLVTTPPGPPALLRPPPSPFLGDDWLYAWALSPCVNNGRIS